jgi:drug/metabolite transporter (DMT)-like permease
MSAPAGDPQERPLLAIGLVLLAMFLFTTTDGAAKHLAASMAPEQVIWVRYGVIVALLLPVLWLKRGERLLATSRPGLHVLRGLLLMVSGLIFVFALESLPLETCTAIGFVSPFYVTALSIPFLGEKVGRRRWAAVGVGFLGVLLILRPGGGAFQWAMLLPLLSSFCWALGLIITRHMRGSERALTVLVYSSLVGFVASAPLALPHWRQPEALEWLLLAGVGAFNALGQYLVIRAFMMASASLLAPFSYSTILWAALIGAFVFASFPDAATLAGTSVLVAAGLYVWHRERVRTTPATVPNAALAQAVEGQGEAGFDDRKT